MSSRRSEIERLVGGQLPPGLDALSATDLDALAAAISDASRQQQSALASAIDNGLNIVPRVLRGTVRKALFG